MKRILSLSKQIIKTLYFNIFQSYYSIAGYKVECNICHYKTNKFRSDEWYLYCTCPKCGSGIRQRLLLATFTFLNDYSFSKIINNKNVLHFAPEKSLSKLIKGKAKIYSTADFLAQGYSYHNIDYCLDISDMKEIENGYFDCVIACDVLEHVKNDREGIKEVFRILNNGGYCIFTVPQKDHLEHTFEDFSITDPKEREKLFGQFDHLRIYGNDFVNKLKETGFNVTSIDEKYFEQKIIEKFVLFPPVLSKHPLATNYRKVFIGKK